MDGRADKSVNSGRGKPFKLAELGGEGGRGGDKDLGVFFENELTGAIFMLGVEIREQKTDGDRFNLGVFEFAGRLADRELIERNQDLAMRRNESLRNTLAMAAADQGAVLPGNLLLNGVVMGPLVAPDVENIAVALGGNHTRGRAFILQQGVGRDRGTVVDQSNTVERDGLVAAQLGDRAHDPQRRII